MTALNWWTRLMNLSMASTSMTPLNLATKTTMSMERRWLWNKWEDWLWESRENLLINWLGLHPVLTPLESINFSMTRTTEKLWAFLKKLLTILCAMPMMISITPEAPLDPTGSTRSWFPSINTKLWNILVMPIPQSHTQGPSHGLRRSEKNWDYPLRNTGGPGTPQLKTAGKTVGKCGLWATISSWWPSRELDIWLLSSTTREDTRWSTICSTVMHSDRLK